MRSWLKNWHLRVEAFIWGTGTCGLTFEGQRQWSKTWIMVQYIAQHVDKKLAAITADQWKISSGTILGSGMPQKRILFLRFLPQKMSCNRLCKIPGSERQKHCKNMPGYRNFYFSANVWVNQTIVGVCVSGHLATILPSNSNDQWWQTGTNWHKLSLKSSCKCWGYPPCRALVCGVDRGYPLNFFGHRTAHVHVSAPLTSMVWACLGSDTSLPRFQDALVWGYRTTCTKIGWPRIFHNQIWCSCKQMLSLARWMQPIST